MTTPVNLNISSWTRQPDAPILDGSRYNNARPSGVVTISGILDEGETLTANNTLSDPETLGTFTYQWENSVSGNVGTNSSTYVSQASDVGDQIRVTISYTDGSSQAESKTSSWTSVIATPTGGGSSYTATHYVAPYASVSGGISDTNAVVGTAYASATTISSPCTLGAALLNASAGDIIECAAGVFTGSIGSDRFTPAWMFANSGTSLNPIIIYALNPASHNASGRTELRNGETTDDAGSPTFGANNQDYIIWDGFFVNENVSASTPDTSPAIMSNCQGIEFRRCVIQGDPYETRIDNHSSIRIEASSDVKVLDCKMYDNYTGQNAFNGSCIMVYSSENIEFAYNGMYNSDSGIFIKDDGSPAIQMIRDVLIHHNHVHDMDGPGITYEMTSADSGAGNTGTFGTKVYQNLVVNCGAAAGGIVLRGLPPNPCPQDCWVVNNTIYNSTGYGIYTKANEYYLDNIINNNIIHTAVNGIGDEDWAAWSGITSDDNMFYNLTRFGRINYTNYATRSAWNTLTGQEANSSESDPTFVTNGSDFTLDTGSPALNAGTDTLNLLGGGTGAAINYGCYILAGQTDEIGVRATPTY